MARLNRNGVLVEKLNKGDMIFRPNVGDEVQVVTFSTSAGLDCDGTRVEIGKVTKVNQVSLKVNTSRGEVVFKTERLRSKKPADYWESSQTGDYLYGLYWKRLAPLGLYIPPNVDNMP